MKDKKGFIITVVSIIIVIIIGGILYFNKINSNSYKLGRLGYNKDEIKIILDKKLETIALREYNEAFTKFVSSKYFLETRLERYLQYYNNNKDKEIEKIISIVNANTDKDFYSDIKKVSEINNFILVNKYYQLDSSYEPDDLTNISLKYAYEGHKIKKEVNDAFVEMTLSAKEAGLVLIANSSYRSYASQETTYNNFIKIHGQEKADKLCARAGHSEHQSGLALDITTKLSEEEEFEDTEEFDWLKNNAYKYGFILRYPKDKEDITGYTYEPWHYRYVGIEIAKKIYQENITFDEYYTYYIENKVSEE